MIGACRVPPPSDTEDESESSPPELSGRSSSSEEIMRRRRALFFRWPWSTASLSVTVRFLGRSMSDSGETLNTHTRYTRTQIHAHTSEYSFARPRAECQPGLNRQNQKSIENGAVYYIFQPLFSRGGSKLPIMEVHGSFILIICSLDSRIMRLIMHTENGALNDPIEQARVCISAPRVSDRLCHHRVYTSVYSFSVLNFKHLPKSPLPSPRVMTAS